MALGLTQPLAEKSTRNLPGDNFRSARKADNLTAISELTVWKMCDPRRLYRNSFTFTLLPFRPDGQLQAFSHEISDVHIYWGGTV
jgi:hypothetical protein